MLDLVLLNQPLKMQQVSGFSRKYLGTIAGQNLYW